HTRSKRDWSSDVCSSDLDRLFPARSETIAPMTENLPGSDDLDTSDQIAVRMSKRERLLERGEEPYPVAVPVTSTIAEVRSTYGHLEAGQETDDVVGVAGRVVFQRNTGKLAFVTIQDGAGQRLQ